MEDKTLMSNVDDLFKGYPRHLSVSELMDVLDISRPTAYRWLQEGKVPAYLRNGTWVILRDDVRDWLKEGRNDPPPDSD